MDMITAEKIYSELTLEEICSEINAKLARIVHQILLLLIRIYQDFKNHEK